MDQRYHVVRNHYRDHNDQVTVEQCPDKICQEYSTFMRLVLVDDVQ